MMRRCLYVSFAAIIALANVSFGAPPSARAVGIPTSDFSIEVSPSPLVATVQPGKPSVLDLKIRNASLQPEQLKIEARSFVFGGDTQSIDLSDSTPDDLRQWVHYSAPAFTIAPGEWFTQKVTIALPESAGFSYSFALVISRVNETATDPTNGRLLKGSVAVFTLVNVDKPGATRKLEIDSFGTDKPVYEYLPTTLKLRLKNTGNSIVQPYGNFYVQRGNNATKPLAVLPVNDNHGYILPGVTREITATWSDGFPVYKKSGDTTSLDWSSHNSQDFRFGKYTAKVVAVYNDGTRDVPLSGTVTFWVIPWKIILGILVALALIVAGGWSILRGIGRKLKRLRDR